jgi:hypothetical protein
VIVDNAGAPLRPSDMHAIRSFRIIAMIKHHRSYAKHGVRLIRPQSAPPVVRRLQAPWPGRKGPQPLLRTKLELLTGY